MACDGSANESDMNARRAIKTCDKKYQNLVNLFRLYSVHWEKATHISTMRHGQNEHMIFSDPHITKNTRIIDVCHLPINADVAFQDL